MANLQIIIPIYKPDEKFIKLLREIKTQTLKNIPLLIIDSGSNELYKNEIADMPCTVKKIDVRTFNHGRTRQMGMELFPEADIYIFFTQDAILAKQTSLENLVNMFKNPKIGCVYGRQLPHQDADIFARHARNFNYAKNSYIRTIADKKDYGLKIAFMSNSFAAYRKTALKDVGGFPCNVILAEDMFVAAKMLLNNWSVAYCAQATVYHSHNYTIWQEFERYFDTGVFHKKEPWLIKTFGRAEGAGKAFVISEIQYILKTNPWKIPEMFIRTGMKLLGYKLGLNEAKLCNSLRRRISMNKNYWN